MKTLFPGKCIGVALAISLHASTLFAQNGTVTGTIKAHDEALVAASVSIGDKTTTSDKKGTFKVSLKPGTYMLIASYTGYKKIEQEVRISANSTTTVDITLTVLGTLEEIVITGSRSLKQRTILDAPVPIDVYSGGRMIETGQVSLTQMLNFLSPSFNASREILNEPSTLRGLDPQHVLILINGTRYHSMAWYFSGGLRGQLGKGSVGNDLNSIPFPAIEKIEILRDGAAAQYGSDAIGGVINIILKKEVEKTTLQLHGGQFYRADGEKFFAGLYHGLTLRKKKLSTGNQGFIGVSALIRSSAPTFRGGTYEGLVYLNYPSAATSNDSAIIKMRDDSIVNARGFNRRSMIDNAGITKLNTSGLLINGGYPLTDRHELKWIALLNSRRLDRGGLFRFPKDSSFINYFMYPDGTQQRNKSNTVDGSFAMSLHGRARQGLLWEIKGSYGINSVRSRVTNGSNPSQTLSLGNNAQTSFYTGTDKFSHYLTNISLSKQWQGLNIATGAEWRLENYQSIIGEEASWYNYDTLNYSQGGVGAAGPESSVNKSRNIFGVYLEIENEFFRRLFTSIAGRYEYYSDFGGNIAGKFVSRYKLSNNFKLRASINNGFRAPSLQQRYVISISEIWTGSNRVAAFRGIFPNSHPVVRAFNIPSLTAEKTINVSGGFSASFSKNIQLTIDAYWIQIKDRIVLSGNFERRPGNYIDNILILYPELNNINRISFFTNAINTRTKGIDIMIDGNWSNKRKRIGINLAANFNKTLLYGPIKTSDKLETSSSSATTLFNSEDKTRIEKGQPASKIILTTIYAVGKINVILRHTRFGETMIAPLIAKPEKFSSKILTDLSVGYDLRTGASITVGVNNIANIYPDPMKDYNNTGQGSWIYSPEASPFGFNGGYYYLQLNLGLHSLPKKANNSIIH